MILMFRKKILTNYNSNVFQRRFVKRFPVHLKGKEGIDLISDITTMPSGMSDRYALTLLVHKNKKQFFTFHFDEILTEHSKKKKSR